MGTVVMNKTSTIVFVFGILSLTILTSGCGKDVKLPPPSAQVNVEIKAAAELNPDESGRPSPVVLRIYALKSLGKFNSANFYDLYNDDQAQLGGDLVNVEEFHLTPGGQKIYVREIPPDALYLGVLAAYRGLINAVWRDSIPMPGGRATNFTVKLGENTVSIRAE